jgi:hypothetical protein
MTVKELISALNNLPQDSEVLYRVYDRESMTEAYLEIHVVRSADDLEFEGKTILEWD